MMHSLSAAEWLDAWERALAQGDVERPLTLLAAATGATREELARLPIGVRNEQLLALRGGVFGDEMNAVANCPNCGETLELSLRVSELLTQGGGGGAATRELRVNGFALTYRLPDTNDLLAAQKVRDAVTAREVLLERVVVNVALTHEGTLPAMLDAHAVEALTAELERVDPLAVLRTHLVCPNCADEWDSMFEIAGYFWAELDAWAKRLLREVHALASAYGWSEADILALSPQRRRWYLEMVRY